MAKITLVYNFNKSNNAEKAIYLLIYFSRTIRKVISTKIFVTENQWDTAKELIINHPGALLLNLELAKLKTKYKQIELDALRNGQLYTKEYLNAKTKGDKNISPSFCTYMYKTIIAQKHLEIGTIKDHQKTLKHFSALFPNLKFEEFTSKTVQNFENWLVENKYAKTTRANHHKNLKKYLNLAAVSGVYEYSTVNYPYSSFKVNRGHGSRCFLDSNELKQLENINLPNHLDKYRKIFLFLCYTGLRISDFIRLEKSMLRNNILIVCPQKTNKYETEVRIPLAEIFEGKPLSIWKEFNYDFNAKSAGFSNKLNINIKLIADIANIKKKLTCHVARHTFLTFIAIKTGNVLKVMKLGGLKKIDTAMIYIHLAEQDSVEFVRGIDWKY